MRVLVSTVPGLGHLHPLLPLAVALRNAGHTVAIATGADLRPRAAQFGFETFTVGLTIRQSFQQLALRFPDAEYNRLTPDQILGWYVPHLFGEIMAPATLADLEPLVRAWRPDVLVHDTWELAAPIAAAAAGMPNVSQTLGLRFSESLRSVTASSVAPLWRARGLEPDPSAGLYRQLCLDITPPGFQTSDGPLPACVSPLRPVPPPLLESECPPDWLRSRDRRRPLVYMTLGTNTNSDQAMFRSVIDGLAESEADLLVTTGPGSNPACLGPLPANAHVEAYVAQSLVLPQCSAVICHAGAGTTLAALALAVPVLALPQGADQYVLAEHLARSGAGLVLPTRAVTPETIRTSVEHLLHDRAGVESARRLQSLIAAMPSPPAAAKLVEEVVGCGSPAGLLSG